MLEVLIAAAIASGEVAYTAQDIDIVAHDIGYPYWEPDVRRATTDLDICHSGGYDTVYTTESGTTLCVTLIGSEE